MAKSFKAVIKKNGNFITNINKDVLVAGVHGSKMKKEDLLADVDDVLDSGLITPMQVASFYKNQQIYKMLQAKAQEMPEELPIKKRHLWFYGAKTGKTYKIREIQD